MKFENWIKRNKLFLFKIFLALIVLNLLIFMIINSEKKIYIF